MSQADVDRYLKAMHAVQTGIAFRMEHDTNIALPKHMRTGIDSAMVTDAAIATLLISKGIFTRDEYDAELANQAEAEAERQRQALESYYGPDVQIG